MSHNALLAILGKAALDPEFLDKVKADPHAAAKEANVKLTEDQADQLKKMNFDGLKDFGKQVEAKQLAAIIDGKGA